MKHTDQNLRDLYPESPPYNTGMLKVSGIHEIYYEERGNKNGKPILFLHGGPGAGLFEGCSRFFDPEHYRIILFDQRGCGKSTPHACIEENTTSDLVDDIDKLRRKLGVYQWTVFGGSWGSTLALAYAEKYPQDVRSLILRGIYLGRRSEVTFSYELGGTSEIFPEAWERYIKPIPEHLRSNLVDAYWNKLHSTNKVEQLQAARAWSIWEDETSSLFPPSFEDIDKETTDEMALAIAFIECHYFVNDCFFPSDNHLLENIGIISHIPATIVQGDYDMVCPRRASYELHKALPKSKYVIIHAGHSCFGSPSMIDALVHAADDHRFI